MRSLKFGVSLFVLLAAFHALAFGEMFRGTIASIDPVSSLLTLSHADPATGIGHEVKISVSESTQFKGIGALEELKPGDAVKVEAKENKETGLLEAKKIEKERTTVTEQPMGQSQEQPTEQPAQQPAEGEQPAEQPSM